jgi:phosphoribosylamine--glycine ligase
MKILVVGSGGREHCLVWKIAQSPLVEKIFCAPGNAGISELAECANISANDTGKLLAFAGEENIDLTLWGPEEPLCNGAVDLFTKYGFTSVGPFWDAARIEGSKYFAKKRMDKYGIPTAKWQSTTNVDEARDIAKEFLRKFGLAAIKADGLTAGKGVALCQTLDEAVAAIDKIMVRREFGFSGKRAIIEEGLRGQEASYMAFTDGRIIVPLAASQDHKALRDGDKGLFTGGMGAYSPTLVVTSEVESLILEQIMYRLIMGMEKDGEPYKGILYAGLMIQDGLPKVIEFNARFGDPETQAVLVRMKSDIVPFLLAVAQGTLQEQKQIEWYNKSAVCVVMASGGYPESYKLGHVISGLEKVKEMKDVFVFHAGTAVKNGNFVNNGGRVFGVTGLGEDLDKGLVEDIKRAKERTYSAVRLINWRGVQYRTDISDKVWKEAS